MKRTFLLLITFFALNSANAEPTATMQQDTVKVEQTDRKCNKAKRRATKRTGKKRTKAGSIIWDILEVLKEVLPLVGLISK